MATGSVVSEDDYVYILRLFDTSFIVCPKSDQSVSQSLAKDFFWKSWVSLWVLQNVKENDLFVDVGASSGYFSAIAAMNTFNVWSFEPNPEYKGLLLDTADLNWVDMTVFPVALSDEVGLALLSVPEPFEGHGSIVRDFDRYKVREFEVETLPLDKFTPPESAEDIIIKVCVEGAEEKVWDGSQSFRTMYRPTFLIEYTPGEESNEFLDKLQGYGEVTYINYEGREVPLSKSRLEGMGDWMTLVVRP